MEVDAKRWRHEFESSLPTWRIDVGAADYRAVERADSGLTGFVLPADVGTADAALDMMAKSIDAFTRWFGPAPGAGYTLIEVPEGYGSQPGPRYLVQTADETVGHDDFQKTVRTFLGRYRRSGAKLPDFKAVAEATCGRELDRLWNEWIEQGEPSTTLLQQYREPARIAARYR